MNKRVVNRVIPFLLLVMMMGMTACGREEISITETLGSDIEEVKGTQEIETETVIESGIEPMSSELETTVMESTKETETVSIGLKEMNEQISVESEIETESVTTQPALMAIWLPLMLVIRERAIMIRNQWDLVRQKQRQRFPAEQAVV